MKNNKLGFSLLELMISVAILLIVISGLFVTFVYCILMNESNNNLVKAANDAQYVMEQIKGLDYHSIDLYSAPEFSNLTGETISLDKNVGTQIAQVTVNVAWTERARSRQFGLSTRIAHAQ